MWGSWRKGTSTTNYALQNLDPWKSFVLPGTIELKIQKSSREREREREREITCPFHSHFRWVSMTSCNWLLLCSSYFIIYDLDMNILFLFSLLGSDLPFTSIAGNLWYITPLRNGRMHMRLNLDPTRGVIVTCE